MFTPSRCVGVTILFIVFNEGKLVWNLHVTPRSDPRYPSHPPALQMHVKTSPMYIARVILLLNLVGVVDNFQQKNTLHEPIPLNQVL